MRLPIWEFKIEKLLSQIDMAAKLKEYEVNWTTGKWSYEKTEQNEADP